MSVFDYKEEHCTQWCETCNKETPHSRTANSIALWTCRDPGHSHPCKHCDDSVCDYYGCMYETTAVHDEPEGKPPTIQVGCGWHVRFWTDGEGFDVVRNDAPAAKAVAWFAANGEHK